MPSHPSRWSITLIARLKPKWDQPQFFEFFSPTGQPLQVLPSSFVVRFQLWRTGVTGLRFWLTEVDISTFYKPDPLGVNVQNAVQAWA
eukprot:999829-Prorocentrum_minimum.AAC.6